MTQSPQRFKAEFFKTLAHPTRIRILELLRNGEKSVSELQAELDSEGSTVSQQLAILLMKNLVGTVDDPGEKPEGRIGQAVLDDDRLEAAAAVDMAQLDLGHVKRKRSLALGHGPDLIGADEQELRVRVHEPADQPGAGDPVDVG